MAWFPSMERKWYSITNDLSSLNSICMFLDITWLIIIQRQHNKKTPLNIITATALICQHYGTFMIGQWKYLHGLIHAQQSSKQCFTKQLQRLGLATNNSPSKMANIYIISHNLVIWRSYTLFELYIHLSNIIP